MLEECRASDTAPPGGCPVGEWLKGLGWRDTDLQALDKILFCFRQYFVSLGHREGRLRPREMPILSESTRGCILEVVILDGLVDAGSQPLDDGEVHERGSLDGPLVVAAAGAAAGGGVAAAADADVVARSLVAGVVAGGVAVVVVASKGVFNGRLKGCCVEIRETTLRNTNNNKKKIFATMPHLNRISIAEVGVITKITT